MGMTDNRKGSANVLNRIVLGGYSFVCFSASNVARSGITL